MFATDREEREMLRNFVSNDASAAVRGLFPKAVLYSNIPKEKTSVLVM